MIFTCNFANWEKIPVPVTPITICVYPPKGVQMLSYPPLFPPKDLVKTYKDGYISDALYKEVYNKQVLDLLDVAKVVTDLYELAGENGAVVLLCYESSDKFCHRHIVRQWLDKYEFATREFNVRVMPRMSLGLRKKHD